jgi:hypothetical protein
VTASEDHQGRTGAEIDIHRAETAGQEGAGGPAAEDPAARLRHTHATLLLAAGEPVKVVFGEAWAAKQPTGSPRC